MKTLFIVLMLLSASVFANDNYRSATRIDPYQEPYSQPGGSSAESDRAQQREYERQLERQREREFERQRQQTSPSWGYGTR